MSSSSCERAAGDPGSSEWASVGRWCFGGSPATSLSTASVDSLPVDVDSISEDGRWARVAPKVPGGWGGGAFLDHGVMTMYLTDPSQRLDALAALSRLGVDGHAWGPDVQVRRGRWNFVQLHQWYRYINQHLGSVAISASDIDQAHNRLLYSAPTDADKRKLEARLSALGVPCFLVAVEVRPYATPA